jgi:hypothetical protein
MSDGPDNPAKPPQTLLFDEWMKLGKELYGDDVKLWEFTCPSCKLVNSIALNLEHGIKSEFAYSECIGRHTKKLGCDWAAYGLFNGPRELLQSDGTHRAYVFYFAKEVV